MTRDCSVEHNAVTPPTWRPPLGLTRWLTAEHKERYRPRIEAGHQLRDLVAEIDALEVSATERAEGWDA